MRTFNILGFICSFSVARGLLFFSPILLANLLPLEEYGKFEIAQAMASIGALVISCGLTGTAPLLRLRDEIKGRWDSLLLLIAAMATGCLVVALLAAAALGSLYSVTSLTAIATSVLIMQGLWANTLKSDGRTTIAVFVEAGFWAVAVFGAGMLALFGDWLTEATISATLLAYAAVLMTVTLVQFVRNLNRPITACDLWHNLELGLPLMLTGVLTVLVTSSGRLILGQTNGVEVVGLYAVLYRSTTLPLAGHQILIIGFFRQIFSWPDEVLRARASVIVLGVTGMVLAFWLLEPALGFLLGQRFTETFKTYRTEGLTLLMQTVLWSAIALNDLINSRLQIAGRVARATAPVLVLGLGALWIWTRLRADNLDTGALLQGFILGHFALMATFYTVQCAASALLGHHFPRLWLTVAGCTGSAVGLVFLGEYIR